MLFTVLQILPSCIRSAWRSLERLCLIALATASGSNCELTCLYCTRGF